MPSIGWMISTDGLTGLHNSNNGLAVTLIRPFATDRPLNQNTTGEDLEAIFQTDEVDVSDSDLDTNGDGGFVVNPWLYLEHGVTSWRLYYKRKDGGFDNFGDTMFSRSGVEPDRVHEDQYELILEQVQTELENLTSGMTKALSSHPDRLEEDRKGFVHAMAPFSQLPPVISNEVLKFGHIIDFPDDLYVGDHETTGAYLDEDVVIVAVPILRIGGTTYEPDDSTIRPLAMRGNGLPAMAVVDYTGLEVRSTSGNRQFAIIVECARIQSPAGTSNAGDADMDRRQRDVLSMLGGALSPIRVAADIIQSGDNDNNAGAEFHESWIPYLLNSLGNGWLIDDVDTPFDDHVFTVVDKERASKAKLGLGENDTIDLKIPQTGWTLGAIIGRFKAAFQNPGGTPLKGTEEFWLGIGYLIDQVEKRYAATYGRVQGDLTIRDSWPDPDAWQTPEAAQTFWDDTNGLRAEVATHLYPIDVDSNTVLVDEWGGLADKLRDPAISADTIKDWLGHLLVTSAINVTKKEIDLLLQEIETVVNEPTAAECRLRSLELTGGLDPDTRDAIVGEIASIQQGTDETVRYLMSQLSVFNFKINPPNPNDRDAPPVDPTAEAANKVANEAKEAVDDNNTVKALARDDGFPIQIEKPSSDPDRDLKIRGYAIGLRCEVRTTGDQYDNVEQEWITNTQITCHHRDGAFVVSDSQGNATTGICAIGSAEVNGMRVTEAIYDGAPLCSVPGSYEVLSSTNAPIRHVGWTTDDDEFDGDGTASLDFGWYPGLEDSLKHIPLGFGLTYASVGSAILNNGIIEEPMYRLEHYEATLIPASRVEDRAWKDPRPYLSNEAVGEPQLVRVGSHSKAGYDFSWTDGQALTSETKASELLDEKIPVTLLVPEDDDAYKKGLTAVTFEFETPLPSPAFIERWLTTDEVLKEKNLFRMISDETLENSQVDIGDFRSKLLANIDAVANDETKDSEDIKHRYHPAIDAVTFTARWYSFDLTTPVHEHTVLVRVPRCHLDDRGEIGPTSRKQMRELLRLSVRSSNYRVSNHEREAAMDNANNRAVLVGPGEIVSVIASSCIDTRLFEGGNGELPRYGRSVSAGKPIETEVTSNENIERYRFDGKPHWFECAPKWDDDIKLDDSWLSIEAPTADRPGLARLLLNADGNLPAEHVAHGRVDRHEWHWTGVPVDFAIADGKLKADWLAAMAGVGSFRNNKMITLAETVEPSRVAPGWRIKDGQALDSVSRSSTGSSSLLAYTFRPEPRFGAWLNSRHKRVQGLRNQVIATGALLRGADPTERLESPSARWIIPLTEGYERQTASDDTLPGRGRNGALMVFDHALMRTDERSQFAGVGEVIDIDVVETRRLAGADWADKEMGPNPVFHPSPRSSDTFQDTGITTSRPFGLTFDKGSNPKVAQTAISVFPDGTGGQWSLAKLRTRRMLEPETLLSYDKATSLDAGANAWHVDLRTEGEDSIPQDIYVEMASKDWPEEPDATDDSKFSIDGKPIPLPKKPATASDDQRVRLRITWHKDRWGTPNPPEWRPRIDAQVREMNRLEWRTASMASAYTRAVAAVEWNPRRDEAAEYSLNMPGNTTGAQWGYLNISDYSEGRWVSFIGMFGQENLDRADEYVLEARGMDEGVEIELQGNNLPILQSVSQSLAGEGPPVFNLLNIYRPTTKVMQGKASESSGEFVGSLHYHGDSLFKGTVNASDIEGCIGYIMSYQHVTALAKFGTADTNEEQELLEHSESLAGVERLVFPEFDSSRGLNQRESILRPVPQFLGPIRITVGNEKH